MTDQDRWQRLISDIVRRLRTVPHDKFYDTDARHYDTIYDEINTAFRYAKIDPRIREVLSKNVPRVPDVEAISETVSSMDLALLSLHIRSWFASERWLSGTVASINRTGLLATALDRFTERGATLPFASYDFAD